ncbi:MAG: DnaJ domain-containing protein [Pseudomonadota bacterium]
MTWVLALLALSIIGLGLFVSVPASALANGMRTIVPIAMIGAGGLLLFARQFMLGGFLIFTGFQFWKRARTAAAFSKSAGRQGNSTVRTAALEMVLDHENGAMDGEVLAGRFEGAQLSALDRDDLLQLRMDVQDDGDSMALLDAYLDRRFAGWREDAQADGDTGQAAASGTGPMGEEEAYEVLGLGADASAADIKAAHRRLMKGLHPDSGGSTFLAAKVNEAKDVLLRSHG